MLQESITLDCPPFSTFNQSTLQITADVSIVPTVCNTVEVDEVCVFTFKTDHTMDWRIGRVLHFVNYLEKTKTAQQYRGLCANIDNKKIGVLCSWYAPSHDSTREYSIKVEGETLHGYLPLSTYLCTLSAGCFELPESAKVSDDIVGAENVSQVSLVILKKVLDN